MSPIFLCAALSIAWFFAMLACLEIGRRIGTGSSGSIRKVPFILDSNESGYVPVRQRESRDEVPAVADCGNEAIYRNRNASGNPTMTTRLQTV